MGLLQEDDSPPPCKRNRPMLAERCSRQIARLPSPAGGFYAMTRQTWNLRQTLISVGARLAGDRDDAVRLTQRLASKLRAYTGKPGPGDK
jgi:hypothetical protein